MFYREWRMRLRHNGFDRADFERDVELIQKYRSLVMGLVVDAASIR